MFTDEDFVREGQASYMTRAHLKPWLGERATAIALVLFLLSLFLYTAAFLVERGFQSLSPATIIAAIATALLLSSVSVTIEQYVKAGLTDPDITSVLAARKLGVLKIQERNASQGSFTGMPDDVLAECHHELIVVAYSADSFVNRNRAWLADALDSDKRVGLLLLHPDRLEQATQTERRDVRPHLDTTIGICEQILAEKPARRGNFIVKGYPGHVYYTGVFVDRCIMSGHSVDRGTVRVQLKANYKTQHEGLVLTMSSNSRYAEFYSDSCKALWNNAVDLVTSASNETADQLDA